MKRLALLTLLLAPLVVAGEEKANPDKAPAFTLKDIANREHALKDYKGKFIVLEWTNHGCPFVKKHYVQGHMQKLQEKYTKQGVVWLQICSSAEGKQGYMTSENWKAFNKKLGVKATATLLDPKGTVGKLYDARNTPQICIIDKEGKRIYDGAIDDKRSKNPEDIATSKNYVTVVLDAVLAGGVAPIRRTKPYGCSVKYAPRQ